MKPETIYSLRVAARRIVCSRCPTRAGITSAFDPDIATFCELGCGFFQDVPRIAEALQASSQTLVPLAAEIEERCEAALKKGPAGLPASGEYAREAFRILEPRAIARWREPRRSPRLAARRSLPSTRRTVEA
jgi:hypothetical protein